jgi:hypothetical protein
MAFRRNELARRRFIVSQYLMQDKSFNRTVIGCLTVPTLDVIIPLGASSILLNPKSMILIGALSLLSFNKKFSGLRSLGFVVRG